MKMKRFFLLVGLVLMAMLMVGCSQKVKIVPDSVLQRQVDSADCYHISSLREYPYTWKATHKVDSAAHTDTVDITITFQTTWCEVYLKNRFVYEYDKTSDLWKVISRASKEWYVDFIYTDRIVGTHHIKVDVDCLFGWARVTDSTCDLTIHSVTKDSINFTAKFVLPKPVEYRDYTGMSFKPEDKSSLTFTVTETVPNDGASIHLGKYLPDVFEEKRQEKREESLYISFPAYYSDFESYSCRFDAAEMYFGGN